LLVEFVEGNGRKILAYVAGMASLRVVVVHPPFDEVARRWPVGDVAGDGGEARVLEDAVERFDLAARPRREGEVRPLPHTVENAVFHFLRRWVSASEGEEAGGLLDGLPPGEADVEGSPISLEGEGLARRLLLRREGPWDAFRHISRSYQWQRNSAKRDATGSVFVWFFSLQVRAQYL
jgi:hypothetical protein